MSASRDEQLAMAANWGLVLNSRNVKCKRNLKYSGYFGAAIPGGAINIGVENYGREQC
jgi:hypothetical protein